MSSSRSTGVIRRYRFVPDAAPASHDAEALPPIVENEVSQEATQADAAAVLMNARAEAERLRAEAIQKAQTIKAQAEAAGRQAGLESGRAEGKAMLQAALQEEVAYIHRIVENVLEERAKLLAETEQALVDLAVVVARKVIGDMASADIEVTARICHQAIEQLGRSANIRVHVNPEDCPRLTEYWERTRKVVAELVPDERVALGGCIVTSGASLVDARIDTQLDLIQQAFHSSQGGQ